MLLAPETVPDIVGAVAAMAGDAIAIAADSTICIRKRPEKFCM
jgi:hypothetical protein